MMCLFLVDVLQEHLNEDEGEKDGCPAREPAAVPTQLL